MNIELYRLKEQGLRILADPQSGEAFGNEKVAFVFAKHGLKNELIETDKKQSVSDITQQV